MHNRGGSMSTGARRWEAVVFDCDGVLLDTEICWTRAEEALFTSRNKEFTLEHKRSLLGTGGPAAGEMLESMLGLPGQGSMLLAELHESARQEFSAGAAATEGAIELLDELTGKVRIGLATNTPWELVEVALSRARVDTDYFGAIVCGDEVLRPKPAPDVYEAACSQLGVTASRSLALEDSSTGVAAAKAAGLAVVGVLSVPGVQLDTDWFFSTLADLELHALLGLDRNRG
jgi:HAD superfamily hydrolase (TIGR01509 family)